MAAASLSFIVGILGNIISLLVFASPIRTFQKIIVKKSTENYKSLPYISTLLSTSLWTFYGYLKPGGLLIMTVNGAGTVLQLIYITLFIIFATKEKKIKTLIALGVLNIGFVGVVIAVNLLAIHGSLRITVVGSVCAALTIFMYASPLTAMRTVIKKKSVEYMPFFLSLFLFLNAGVWSVYSVLVKDYFMGVPNGIGFVLGSTQLILYTIYKNKAEPIKSMDKITSAEIKEGSGHVVIGLTDEEKEATNNSDKLPNKTLGKGNSDPNPKPGLTRQISSLPVILKSLSLGPYDINYSFSRDKNGDIIGIVEDS
ncbi:bidirectional sugar transporter SWEET17-like [Silene latifolia]|uniref:bidirectional sugar transporter SWEET17-like n=1 Tax=Silene latifolia TaxID=37657 RepID=UPI003D76DE0D